MVGATQSLKLADLARLLQQQGARLEKIDFSKALKTVGVYLSAQARRSFDESREPDGTPWLPLKSPSKRRGGSSAKPLRDRGLLMASLTSRGGEHVEDITRVALLWGTNVSYAGYHQEGTKTIPARPFLGVTPAMEDTIAKILTEYVQRLVRG